jgi:6-phosphogluconate dehydrogenase
LRSDPKAHLALTPYFSKVLDQTMPGLRKVTLAAQAARIAVPALSAALAYADTLATARTTANMLQGQRDYFGAHSFERVDRSGAHHGPWLGAHLN